MWAEESAYVGGDPEELTELRYPKGVPRQVVFSCDLAFDRPLRRPCTPGRDAPT
jgi:hypothetical protein